jgi:hypothetical protein
VKKDAKDPTRRDLRPHWLGGDPDPTPPDFTPPDKKRDPPRGNLDDPDGPDHYKADQEGPQDLQV